MRKEVWFVLGAVMILLLMIYGETEPFRAIIDWRSSVKAMAGRQQVSGDYQLYDYSGGETPFITIDFVMGEHFWNPQVAFWIEDTLGNHLATLLVTTSTAKGLFYNGRSVENFKKYDGIKRIERSGIRRVNALPHWAHQRGIKAVDGGYAPHPESPVADGISGATPTANFFFRSPGHMELPRYDAFVIKMEINVAFDQNEFFSEYDYLDDRAYHGGTGLLGQPSLIYGVRVEKNNHSKYYLMSLLGHGHHSGKDGTLYNDMSGITTAVKIVERVVVGVNF